MECHILIDCQKVKTKVKEAVRYIIESREKSGIKQNIHDDQKSLEEFFDTQILS